MPFRDPLAAFAAWKAQAKADAKDFPPLAKRSLDANEET